MDFSGFGNNKTFKAGGDPVDPYIYISATLPMAGAVDGGTYYFNLDNTLEYASNRDYARYVIVDENMVISEVVVFAGEDLVVAGDPENLAELFIGGADRLDSVEPYVQVPWAAPPGNPPQLPPSFSGDAITAQDANNGTVNYFGHEGGHFPYFENLNGDPDLSKRYKYLAVTINPETVRSRVKAESDESKRRKKRAGAQKALPQGDVVFESGTLTVVLKIYPKFTG